MKKAILRRYLLINFMRLTALPVLLLAVLTGTAMAYDGFGQTLLDQPVTIDVRNQTLPTVLQAIEQTTGVRFTYIPALVNRPERMTIEAHNEKLSSMLDRLLKPLQIEYSLRRNYIILRKNSTIGPLTPKMSSANSPTVRVSGQVTDGLSGEPLPGVNIVIGGTPTGSVTDTDGRYQINVPPGATLRFSFIGYQAKAVVIEQEMVLNVALTPAENTLNETVVIGYGTAKRRELTGSVGSVSSKEIEKQPVTNPLQAMQGRIPGVQITQNSGLPGARINVQIRGINSIGAGNVPLYIVDGVPFLGRAVNEQGGNSTSGAAGSISPLNSINPADIESIEVLKDADATSIYGSRAANGVVLITTKKGRSGQTKVTFNLSSGFGNITNNLKTLTTADYLKIRQQAFVNDGVTPTNANAPDLLLWGNQDTNPVNELIGNTSRYTDMTGSVSGGDARTHFLLSSTYHKETTVFPGDYQYVRGAVHLNLDNTSANNKFYSSVSATYTTDDNLLPTFDFTSTAATLPPNYPLYDSDRKPLWNSYVANPLFTMRATMEAKTTNLLGNTEFRYTILPGLTAKIRAGYNRIAMHQDVRLPSTAQNPASTNPAISAVSTDNYTQSVVVEPQADYTKTVGKGTITALVGGTWQTIQNNQPAYVSATGFSSDAQLNNLGAATTVTVSSNYNEYRYASVFGRANYNWMGKYIVNASFRRDGSSRFGPNKRFGNFGAAGAAWIFSEEAFANGKLNWLSFGKLRGSYGTIGNDQILDFQYLSTYSSTSRPYGGTAGLIPDRVANPAYSWETTRKLDAALELGLFDNRIMLTTEWFRHRSGNQLVQTPLSSQSGFSSYQTNLPALVENTGWEFDLSTTNIRKNDFGWTTSFNLTLPKNRLISFPNLLNSSYANTYIEGQPLSLLALYAFTGLEGGVPVVQDVNGDGKFSAGLAANGRGDYIVAGKTTPDLYGGLNNSLRFKGFQFDVFFQFVKQQTPNIRYFLRQPPGSLSNQDARIIDEGFTYSTTAGQPAYTGYNTFYTRSDAVMDNSSYIRLKNVSLSHTLPAGLTKKLAFQHIRVYVQGQNLLTFTNYLGLDPETVSGANLFMPPMKVATAGLQFSF